ncbi:nuclear transport factor 2 family protein [Pedobacter foliorum]|uniref:nuclear transport factor 2 family protein n=1 Tax=Pedobacter foliorum TaxID=2739058 RepID=UPI0015651B73|nr:nuclear transport factor 2 family protein [Pedobacter foliorum]NRF37401.1 nuclear transport factor 2 family protein [Pedobacter foliorum]
MNTEQQLQQTADRLAIRNLVDQYAYCADTRDAQGQMALFTEDTSFLIFMDAQSSQPTQVINNKADLFPVFDNLNTYNATMHFNGQSTVLKLNEETATGITYCIAHHQILKDGTQKLMIAHIKYHDSFVKQNGAWLFSERKLLVDWIENQ